MDRLRRKASCATAAGPARAKTLIPASRWSVVWNRPAASCGPRARNRPPIDHDDMTPSAASTKAGRTAGGTLGRWGVSRKRARVVTGSGMRSAPAKAIANSTKRAT